MELLPSGERAPEQLRQVPSSAGHLCGATRLQRPDPAAVHDGRAGRRNQPPQEGAQVPKVRHSTTTSFSILLHSFSPPQKSLLGSDFHRKSGNVKLEGNYQSFLKNQEIFQV